MRELLLAGDLDAFGLSLHRGHELKHCHSNQIRHATIEENYARQ